jgi:hypothetical protein
MSNAPVSPGDTARLEDFMARWGFELDWPPIGQRPEDPSHSELARAILRGRTNATAVASAFNIRPATDDCPYFWHSVRWSALPGNLRHMGKAALLYADWGPLMLALAVAVALPLAFVLILAPLGRLPASQPPLTRPRILVYFGAIGLGYLGLEMIAFQRCVLLVEHPVIAAASVFSTFLLASGAGALTAPASRNKRAIAVLFGAVWCAGAFAAIVLWLGTSALWRLPSVPRLAVVVLCIAPLAWALGRPMPWGLRQLGGDARTIAWAWGINGVASVVSAPLATLLAVQAGHAIGWAAAMLCYVLACAAALRIAGDAASHSA